MRKLVLLGDSIRLVGYGQRVRELLSPDFEVWQPEDNCRFAAYTLRMCFDYQNAIKDAAVIHYNCGLWDMCDLFGDGAFTPIEDYVKLMVRIARVLKSIAPDAKLIFATTTPTKPEMWGHDIERIKAYNTAVTQALRAEGVRINDLFTPVAENMEDMICEDFIHLTPMGAEVLAGYVVGAVRAAGES